MDKRKLAKMIAKTIVGAAASSLVTKLIIVAIPGTANYKIASVSGTIGGWMITEELEPYTDKFVDDLFDRYAAKQKNQHNPPPTDGPNQGL